VGTIDGLSVDRGIPPEKPTTAGWVEKWSQIHPTRRCWLAGKMIGDVLADL
jgi:hypothetical protein